MAGSQNYQALDWVQGEIEQTLKHAQQALEAFVANPDDSTRMRFCLTKLHQIYGTLKIVEFYGATLLAEEMEQLAQAFLAGAVNNDNNDNAVQTLMQAILQLPAYLDQVKSERKETPASLLPLLNELRAARGERCMSEGAFFRPDVSVAKSASDPGGEVYKKIKNLPVILTKIRQLFQFALAGLFNDQDVQTNFGYMIKASLRMCDVAKGMAQSEVWFVSAAMLEALAAGALVLNDSIKQTLADLDKYLKAICSAEDFGAAPGVPEELLRDLLFFVAKAEPCTSERVREVKEKYDLEALWAVHAQPVGDGGSGPDKAAMRSVVTALEEEMAVVKETLDIFVRGDQDDLEDLNGLLPHFKQIADTLAMLGLNSQRSMVQDQLELVSDIVSQGTLQDQKLLLSVADDLVEVEASLAHLIGGHGDGVNEALRLAREAVLKESRGELEQAKEGIAQFISSNWSLLPLRPVPGLLHSVQGSIAMIPLPHCESALARMIQFVEHDLLAGDAEPEQEQMVLFADALTGVEYYLERLDLNADDDRSMLDIAESALSALGYPADGEPPLHPSVIAAVAEEAQLEAPTAQIQEVVDEAEDQELYTQAEPQQGDSELDETPTAAAESTDVTALTEPAVESSDNEFVSPIADDAEDGLPDVFGADSESETFAAEAEALPSDEEEPLELSALENEQGEQVPVELKGVEASDVASAVVTDPDPGANADPVINIGAMLDEESDQTGAWGAIEASLSNGRPDDESEFEPDAGSELQTRGELQDEPVVQPSLEDSPLEVSPLQEQEQEQAPAAIEDIAAQEVQEEEPETAPETVADDISLGEVDDNDADSIETDEVAEADEQASDCPTVKIDLDAPLPSVVAEDSQPEEWLDEEVVEIFVEEAQEVMECIETYYPRWRANISDTDALKEVRRSFHTLKGSGRMVGANVVGEASWAVENMLNRVLDRTIELSPAVYSILDRALECIPILVEAFEQQRPAPLDIQPLVQAAGVIAMGGTVVKVNEVKPIARAAGSQEAADEAPALLETAQPTASVVQEEESSQGVLADEEMDEGIDPVLLEIFKEEALGHVAVLKEFLLESGGVDASPTNELLRALHTLKGCANMAEVTPVAEVVTPLERVVKRIHRCNQLLDYDFQQFLKQFSSDLGKMLQSVLHDPFSAVVAQEPYVLELKTHVARLLTAEQAEGIFEGVDIGGASPFVAKIFLTETMDQLLSADQDLRRCQANIGTAPTVLGGLVSALDTLRFSAQDANLDEVSTLARSLEYAYRAVQEGAITVDDGLFAAAHEAHEVLIEMMDSVANGLSVVSADSLSSRLLAMVPSEVVAAFDALPKLQPQRPASSSDIPQSETPQVDATAALPPEPIEVVPEQSAAADEVAPAEVPEAFEVSSHDAEHAAEEAEVSEQVTPEVVELALAPVSVESSSTLPELSEPEPLEPVSIAPQSPEPVLADEPLAAEAAAVEEGVELRLDPEVVEIFLDEAMDIMASASKLLSEWREAPGNTLRAEELQRDLHTLKGGARLAEVTPIGDLAERLESLYEAVCDERVPVSGVLFTLIGQGHDAIDSVLSSLQSGAPLIDVRPLIEDIDDFREVHLDDFSLPAEDETETSPPTSHAQPVAQAPELPQPELSQPEISYDAVEESVQPPAPTSPVVEPAESVDSINSLQAPEPVTGLTASTDDRIRLEQNLDPEVVEIFLEEAADIVASANNLLADWEKDLSNLLYVDELQRDLHTLKGGARLAEIAPLSDLAHRLESLYEGVCDNRFPPDDTFLGHIKRCHALIEDSMVALRSQEDLPNPAQVMAEVDQFFEENSSFKFEHQGLQGKLEPRNISARRGRAVSLEEFGRDVDAEGSPGESADPASAAPADQPIQADESVATPQEAQPVSAHSVSSEAVPLQTPAATTTPAQSQAVAASQVADTSAPTPLQPQAVEVEMVSPLQKMLGEDYGNLDLEVFDIFLEEAEELSEQTDEALNAWLAEPDNMDHGNLLKRLVHTLKGGARLSGLRELGDLTHEFETFLDGMPDGAPDAQFLQSTQQQFDQMAHRVTQLRGAMQQHEEGTLVPLVDAVAVAPVEPAVSETPVVAEAITPAAEVSAGEAVMAQALQSQESAEPIIAAAEQPVETAEDQEAVSQSAQASAPESQSVVPESTASPVVAPVAATPEILEDDDDVMPPVSSDKDALSVINEDAIRAFRASSFERSEEGIALAARLSGMTPDELTQEYLSADGQQMVPLEPVNLPLQKDVAVSATTTTNKRETRETRKAGGESVKVHSNLLEKLINLAGESSIFRGRVENEVSRFHHTIDDMNGTIDRLRDLLRRLDIETEAHILYRHEKDKDSVDYEDFDPLEMDRYSALNQLSRSLSESASDLTDLTETMGAKVRDAETLLVQQSRVNTELQEGLMRTQLEPFSKTIPRLRRIVRQVAGEVGKEVELEVVNAEGELDRNVLDRMVAPLEHMLRNAVDHGIETPQERADSGKGPVGRITLFLAREGGEVVLRLSDDGKGIATAAVRDKAISKGLMQPNAILSDSDIMQFIFKPGFSTASQVTQISGRGVGMDVVSSEIKQLGGSIKIHSAPGVGTQFTVRLPFTVSVNRALMVVAGEDHYAIPLSNIEGIVRVSPYELMNYYRPDAPQFGYAGRQYNMEYLGRYVHGKAVPSLDGVTKPLPVLLLRSGDSSVALQVDQLLGSKEVVVKSLGPQLSTVSGIAGATITGDGNVVIILDLLAMLRASKAGAQEYAESGDGASVETESRQTPLVMVVDDSVTVRKVTSRLLERNGFDVVLAKDGMDALSKLQDTKPDIMLLDIEMPRMDGFEVASHVRHNDRLKRLPIIMITSRTGEKHRNRAMSLGVNDYMGKPFQETQLLENIQALLKQAVKV